MASTKPAKLALDNFQRIDPSGMYRWLVDFPAQVEEAVRIGTQTPFALNANEISALVLTGMGGSAIGGDLLRSYLLNELRVPFIINRSYGLPAFVDHTTLVIVSSYSGYTEETVAAYRDALRRKASVLCITTGGETEHLARKHGNLLIKIPSGLQPRAALGYSFFPLLIALTRTGFAKPRARDIQETVNLLKCKSPVYGDVKSRENLPLQLARRLYGKLPIIYSASNHFDAVNVRWRSQICENAKHLAFGHVLPEMNHNEIAGWKVDRALMKRMAAVFLRDRKTHARVRVREEITKGVIQKYASDVLEVWTEGKSLLARLFSLVYFGDWVSFYLAILNKEDPTPVKVIQDLKGELAKV
jgi:glucose/mannose-6-phosphate isomerase